MQTDPRPIFVASVFKSGTWMVRRLLEQLTGLAWCEPHIVPGEMNYGDPGLIDFRPGHFFSWHSEPTPAVRELLRERQARSVLVTRNIYDLAVSMYRHFAKDIDHEIGRGAGQQELFSTLTRGQGIALVINGASAPRFQWVGIGPHLRQMQLMLEMAAEQPCCVLTFEQLVEARGEQIKRVAEHLELNLSPAQLEAADQATSFATMKAQGDLAGRSSHFQEGRPGRHKDLLERYHVYMVDHLLRTYAPHLKALAAQQGLESITRCGIEGLQ